jgi:predicted DNA-binding transcriptional regulator YafY
MRNAEVIRQWQILRELETRRGVTIHDLASLVNVSTRTIRRDLEALQYAGFALYDEGEENATKTWHLNLQPFKGVQDGLSVSDVAALFLSRSVFESLSGWPLADELRTAFEKIERGLNPRMREFLAALPDVVFAKPGPKSRQGSPALVDITRRLFDAVHDRRIVEARYFSATSNLAKSYLLQPYRLALANGGLYLVAWVPAYEAFRTFAVERIEKLSVREETFKPTRKLPADLFGASMGVFVGTPVPVEVEFEAGVAPFVRSRVWHDSQQLHDLPSGRLRMTLHVSNDAALLGWILGFGSQVRVVAPKTLRASVTEEWRRALERSLGS